MVDKWDAVVIGSGFGGAVTAARLSERGMRVLVLERGPWWGPGGEDRPRSERRPYPRGSGLRRLMRGVHWAKGKHPRDIVLRRDGLMEAHVHPGLLAISASGVGGGSHLYTNILAQPESEYFDGFVPEITGPEMDPYFDAVRAMLRPAKSPKNPPRTTTFASAVAAAGLGEVEYPDLAQVFNANTPSPSGTVNAAGVVQQGSTYSGTDILGCNDRSKTTLDLTYLPLALRHGARIRAFAEVTSIGRDGTDYVVKWRDHMRGAKDGLDTVVRTPRLILAAGTFGTLRLLLRARDLDATLPDLPARLGEGMTPNADMATVVYRSELIKDGGSGPPFGSFNRVRDDGRHRYLVGDLGLPLAALPLPGPARRRLSESMVIFGMGRDKGGGRAWLENGRLRTDLGRALDPELYADMEMSMERIAAELGAKRVLYNWPHGRGGAALTTVHTEGGAAIGSGPDNGVVDHRGMVFGHPGLYVADGSLFPAPPGIPPSMTIAALAERQAALIDDASTARSTGKKRAK